MITQVQYTDTALPDGDDTVTLFNSVDAGMSRGAMAQMGERYFDYDIAHDQEGTVDAYFSDDGGVSWTRYHTETHPVPALTSVGEIEVAGYRDVRVLWTNSESALTTFNLQLSLDTRSDSWHTLVLPYTANMLQRLDAGRGITPDIITGRAAAWADLDSGLANNATQPTDADQPAITRRNESALFNGRPFVSGDGVSRHMTMDSIATALTGDDTPFYIIAAININTPTQMWWTIDSSLNGTHFHYQQLNTTTWRSRRRAGDATSDVNAGALVAPPRIFEIAFDGAETSMWDNGAQIVAGAAQANVALAVDQATLFARRPSGVANAFGDNDLADLVTYFALPADSDKADLRHAMGAWYGATVQ